LTAFSVEAALDHYVEKLEEERQPDGYWHPSGLFGCARQAVYGFLGVPKSAPDRKSKRIFRIGHVTHDFIQRAVGAHPGLVLFLPEVKILDEERKLKGHADGLGFYEDGTAEVFEFKSTRSGALRYGDLPKDDHRKQVTSYVSVLRRHGGTWKIDPEIDLSYTGTLQHEQPWEIFTDDEGSARLRIPPLPELEHVRIAYLAKDDWEIREFEQKHTDQKEAWLDDYLARLRRHVDEGTLPMRLPNKTLDSGRVSPTQHHYLCGYCPFAARCWSQDQEGVE
jgi:hypothetical protein